jgi:hypothetical protein
MVDEVCTEKAGSSDSKDAARWGNGSTVAILVTICAGLAIYFCSLQNTFYSHYQPFFDSLSYFNEVHKVMVTGQQHGVSASLQQAFDMNSTVFAPKCIAAIVSPLFKPSRNFAVWLQIAEVLTLLLSLFYYFRTSKNATPGTALILLTPFLLTSCLYQSHGGVSDFRMDLSLYLMYSVSCVWYLIATETRKRGHFVLLGLAIAATCLFRATAPVYMMLSLGPIVLSELLFAKGRGELLKGLCVAGVVAVSGSCWFYLSNFDYLQYYYFVWNTDANAKLSLGESLRHVNFAFDHVGIVFLCWLAVMNGLLLFANQKNSSDSFGSVFSATVQRAARQTDFRLIWLAIAPIGMLVLRGAGLNPFVSMPAVFGLVIYLTSSLANDRSLFQYSTTRKLAAVASVAAVLAMGFEGWKDHQAGKFNSMSAHKQTIRQIVDDAKIDGLEAVTLDSSHMFYLHPFSLEGTMRFDFPGADFKSDGIGIHGVQLQPRSVFSRVVAQANWDELNGSPRERLEQLVNKADAQVDYLILPDRETADFLEQNVAHNLINQHQNELRNRILSSRNWVPVGNPIRNSDQETLQLYKNQRRVEVARGRSQGYPQTSIR